MTYNVLMGMLNPTVSLTKNDHEVKFMVWYGIVEFNVPLDTV